MVGRRSVAPLSAPRSSRPRRAQERVLQRLPLQAVAHPLADRRRARWVALPRRSRVAPTHQLRAHYGSLLLAVRDHLHLPVRMRRPRQHGGRASGAWRVVWATWSRRSTHLATRRGIVPAVASAVDTRRSSARGQRRRRAPPRWRTPLLQAVRRSDQARRVPAATIQHPVLGNRSRERGAPTARRAGDAPRLQGLTLAGAKRDLDSRRTSRRFATWGSQLAADDARSCDATLTVARGAANRVSTAESPQDAFANPLANRVDQVRCHLALHSCQSWRRRSRTVRSPCAGRRSGAHRLPSDHRSRSTGRSPPNPQAVAPPPSVR